MGTGVHALATSFDSTPPLFHALRACLVMSFFCARQGRSMIGPSSSPNPFMLIRLPPLMAFAWSLSSSRRSGWVRALTR